MGPLVLCKRGKMYASIIRATHTYTPTHLHTYTPTHLHTYTHTHTHTQTKGQKDIRLLSMKSSNFLFF